MLVFLKLIVLLVLPFTMGDIGNLSFTPPAGVFAKIYWGICFCCKLFVSLSSNLFKYHRVSATEHDLKIDKLYCFMVKGI